MAAHRYWRIAITGTSDPGGIVRLDEVRFIRQKWFATLSAPVVTASSTAAGGYSASGLVDGKTTAGSAFNFGWQSVAPVPATLTFDFTTTLDIDGVQLWARPDAANTHFPTALSLQFSDDAVSWTALWSLAGLTSVRAPGEVVSFDASGQIDLVPPLAVDHNPLAINSAPPIVPVYGVAHMQHLVMGSDAGNYRVSGTVSISNSPPPNLPVSRRVRLYRMETGQLVREMLSAEGTGAYSFDGISPGRYFVVAHDHTEFYNAVIADRIEAEFVTGGA